MWGFVSFLLFSLRVAMAVDVADSPGGANAEALKAVRALPTAVGATAPTGACPTGTLGAPASEARSHTKVCPAERHVRLILTWKGRRHPYLQNPIIDLGTQAAALRAPDADTATASALFGVPEKSSRLAIPWQASFEPTLKLHGMKAGRRAVVLSAHETETVLWPPCEAPRLSDGDAPSPLVGRHLDWSAADPATATVTAEIQTAVVDLTDLWPEAAAGLDTIDRGQREDPMAIWTATDPGHNKMRMLGSTNGIPSLWTAYIPAADTDPSKAGATLSRIVVYPQEITAYDPPIGVSAPRHTLLYADKLLISDCLHPTKAAAAGTECHYTYNKKKEHTNWIPTSFGPALEATGKRAVIFIPWVESANDTVGKGMSLAERTQAMIDLLASEARVSTNPAKPQTSPLVLAGFSGGGEALIAAFEKNRSNVLAVWGFDPISHTGEAHSGVSVRQMNDLGAWLEADPSHQLRVVTTMYDNRWVPFFNKLHQTTEPSQVTRESVQSSTEAMRWAREQDLRDQGIWALHQFAFNGGKETTSGQRTSYFEQFASQLP